MVDYYTADIINAQDYYPFGSIMPGRNWSNDEYRFGFNGMEKDNEVKGEGNSLDFGARVYDSRLGRWMSVDPLATKYASLSPYTFVSNMPMTNTDVEGKYIIIAHHYNNDNGDLLSTEYLYTYKKDRTFSETTPQFVRETFEALDRLYETNALTISVPDPNDASKRQEVDMLSALINDDNNHVRIQKTSKETRSGTSIIPDDPVKELIPFNPSKAAVFSKKAGVNLDEADPLNDENAGFNSATSALGHELIHKYNSFYDPKYQERYNNKLIDFSNEEEKYVTLDFANQMNKKLGEDERVDYSLGYYSSENVNSITPKR